MSRLETSKMDRSRINIAQRGGSILGKIYSGDGYLLCTNVGDLGIISGKAEQKPFFVIVIGYDVGPEKRDRWYWHPEEI